MSPDRKSRIPHSFQKNEEHWDEDPDAAMASFVQQNVAYETGNFIRAYEFLPLFDRFRNRTDLDLPTAEKVVSVERAALMYKGHTQLNAMFDIPHITSREAYATLRKLALMGKIVPPSGKIGLVGSGEGWSEMIGSTEEILWEDPTYFRMGIKSMIQSAGKFTDPRDTLISWIADVNNPDLQEMLGRFMRIKYRPASFYSFDPHPETADKYLELGKVLALNRHRITRAQIRHEQATVEEFIEDQGNTGYDTIFWNRIDPDIMFDWEDKENLELRAYLNFLALENELQEATAHSEQTDIDTLAQAAEPYVHDLAAKLNPDGQLIITMGSGNSSEHAEIYTRQALLKALAKIKSPYVSIDAVSFVEDLVTVVKQPTSTILNPQGSFYAVVIKRNNEVVQIPPISEEKTVVEKVGRNELCPCGSGKKYKHCHGRN